MKTKFKLLGNLSIVLLGLGLMGCASTGGDANLGKIGPDYADDPATRQLALETQMENSMDSIIP